jgi:uncharacterized protein YdaU (DUF1376 family)
VNARSKKRSPAFQFYPGDWLSSSKIAVMTPAEEGAYIRLLCHAWNDPHCSLPDDDEQLAIFSRLGEGWFNGGSTKIRACFQRHPKMHERIFNLRLLLERKKQLAWSRKSREGGERSGESRRKKGKGGSQMVEPNANQKATLHLQSSSSSSNLRNTPPLPAGASPSKKSGKTFIPPTLPEVQAYAQEYGAKFTDPAEFHGYWTDENWVNRNGRKLRDWRRAFRNRERHLGSRAGSHPRPADTLAGVRTRRPHEPGRYAEVDRQSEIAGREFMTERAEKANAR